MSQPSIFIIFYKLFFGCAGSSIALHFFFSSFHERELFPLFLFGLLMEVASLVEEHRLSGVQVLAAEAHGLSSGSQAPEHRLSGSWA